MPSNVQVLAVGLGPVGDVLAALLGQAGVSVMAIDREPDIYQLPRAAVFDDDVMRTFQQLGLAADILPETRPGNEYEFVNADGKTLMHFDRGELSPLGWAPAYLFHQPAVERVLRRRLQSLDCVDMRLGHRLLAIERNDSDGVLARIAARDNSEWTVRARYLVAADGGASTVRKLLSVELFDYGFEEPWLVIDTLMQDETGLSPHAIQYCDPRRPTTMVPMSPGRRRWEFMLRPGEHFEDMLDDARIGRLLDKFVVPGRAQVVRKAVYQFHGLVAKQWRVGSVFLAGDAAHQMPPFLGQGMCSGIRDAANLAWKLAAVLHEQADSGALESYQTEREPHVRAIIETAIRMGRIVCTLDPELAKQRDAEILADTGEPHALQMPNLRGGLLTASPHAGEPFPQPHVRLSSGRTGRLDDLLGAGAFLISLRSVARGSANVSVFKLGSEIMDDGTLSAWLHRAKADAVLVRPDRYIFGTGDAEQLIEAWRASLRAHLGAH